MSKNEKLIKRILRWTLALVTVLILISGLGITYYTTTEYLTAGLLSKTTAFWIHFYLLIPFVVLFALHIFIGPFLRIFDRLKSHKGFLTRNRVIMVLVIIILAVSVYTVANAFKPETIKLDNVEVKEYKGQNLSSVNDFRENSIKGPQYIDITNYRLEVTGLVNNPKNYTYDEVTKGHQNYEKVVTLDCVEGWDVTILWRGILVKDIIKETNPSPNANTVIF